MKTTNAAKEKVEAAGTPIAAAGKLLTTIDATFSTQFLALLSKHLYSSPNKAFEELISNSWDADATNVYVRIPKNLSDPAAAIWVLDDGLSMDIEGFIKLWTIAESHKRDGSCKSTRAQIGKFGIGKLATYILCNELTYICKAKDGTIRIVTMDYRAIDEAKVKHIEKIPLNVREISEQELYDLLEEYEFGDEVAGLIKAGVPDIKKDKDWEDEFGGEHKKVSAGNDTWTLAILSSLKKEGKFIQTGWVKFLLSTALPLGTSISVDINSELLKSSKSKVPVQTEWELGPTLDITELELEDGTTVKVTSGDKPYPHLNIDGLGVATGKAKFFKDNIDGGKSSEIGSSNGFFLNVLGRVVNYDDNKFKQEHLNHSVFARFRATVRIDSLDSAIAANRENIAEGSDLRIARALFRKLFNLARREYHKLDDRKFDGVGKGAKQETRELPTDLLDNAIQKSIDQNKPLPHFVDKGSLDDEKTARQEWAKATKQDLAQTIETVRFEEKPPSDFHIKYDLKSRSITINKNHPFIKENTQTTEQTNTVRDLAIADLLTDAYMMNCGISEDLLDDISLYRDRALRLMAQIRRNSASQIIANLDSWKDAAKPFEQIVGDALEYLGFSVDRYGQSGEPEGVATAYISPSKDGEPGTYTLTYDAKSTKYAKAQTGNLNIAGLARHREDYEADFALVVAPDFQDGALIKEAQANSITPIKAQDLARLVSITVSYGPIELTRLVEIFKLHDPKKVSEWIEEFAKEKSEKVTVDLSTIISALDTLVTKDKIDILGCGDIAQKCREMLKDDAHPTRVEIAQILRGLSLVAPSIIYMDQQNPDNMDVFMLSDPKMLMKEIKRQTDIIPDDLRYGVLKETADEEA